MSLAGSNSSGTRSRSVQIGKIFRILARFVQSKQRELIMSVTADLPYDPDALRERYREEREKRLRDDGNEQYVEMKGDYEEFLEDPYVDKAIDVIPSPMRLTSSSSGVVSAFRRVHDCVMPV